MKKILLPTLVILAALVLSTPASRAEDLNTIRARMEQRISAIDALKSSGAVGENNRGFLEIRDGGGESESVVAAENTDREKVYAELARKTGTTPEQVGHARARQIANNSAAGVWLQDESGRWYRK